MWKFSISFNGPTRGVMKAPLTKTNHSWQYPELADCQPWPRLHLLPWPSWPAAAQGWSVSDSSSSSPAQPCLPSFYKYFHPVDYLVLFTDIYLILSVMEMTSADWCPWCCWQQHQHHSSSNWPLTSKSSIPHHRTHGHHTHDGPFWWSSGPDWRN